MKLLIKRYVLLLLLSLCALAQVSIQNNIATWNSATALNATLGVDTLGQNTVAVTFVPTGTLSSGTVTFQVSDSANPGNSTTGNWFNVPCAAPTTNASTYTPVSGTNAAVQCNVIGYKRFRVQNSSTIVGTGQYTINVQSATGEVPPANQPLSATTNIGTINNLPATADTNEGNPGTSTLRTVPANYGTPLSNQQSVTGSAVALASNAVQQVCIEALSSNTISIFIGPSGVATSTGYELPPGASVCPMVSNTNLIFVIASTTGASVSWVAVK